MINHYQKLILGVVLVYSLTASAASAADIPDDLAQQAIDAITHQVKQSYPSARYEISLDSLDSKIELGSCNNVQINVRGTRLYGRVPVQVSCTRPVSWRAFLTARVEIWQTVVVLKQSLPRGARILDQHLGLQELLRSKLHSGYLTGLDQAVGQELQRPLSTGAVLYQKLVRSPLAVARGDRVTLKAGVNRVSIRVAAMALDSGRIGEQIRVRNIDSKKVVRGWIDQPGSVNSSSPPGQ